MSTPTQYFNAFNRLFFPWQVSGFREDLQPHEAADALRAWLGEYPGDAKDIEKLALGAAYVGSAARQPRVATAFTTDGRQAALIRPQASDEDNAASALLACLEGNARFESSEPSRDTTLLDETGVLLEKLDERSPFRQYLTLHHHALTGRYAASCLESELASQHLWLAVEAGEPLLHNRRTFRELAKCWRSITWGDIGGLIPDADERIAEFLRRDVEHTYWHAAVALGASCGLDSPKAARKAVETCTEIGLLESPAFQIRNSLLGLSEDERRETRSALLERLPDGHSESTWALLLESTEAYALLRNGDVSSALEAARGLADLMGACRDEPTIALATADKLRVDAAGPDGARSLSVDMLRPFQAGVTALAGSPYLLQYKALFDDHLAAATARQVEVLTKERTPAASIAVSVLLDAVRNPAVTRLPENPRPESVESGIADAADLLGRLDVALSAWPDTAVLITQTVGNETLFVTAEKGAPVDLSRAGPDYRTASLELAKLQAALIAGRHDEAGSLATAGKSVFDLLPSPAREAIARRGNVIIVPDLAAEAAKVPYELIHDGGGFLGATKSMARVQSLGRLIELLEPPVLKPEFSWRNVTVAVPHAAGKPPLVFARAEANDTKRFFQHQGWEVPDVDDEHLTSLQLLDALELADFIHIAAHGEIGVGRQAVVLPLGKRLSVEDLEQRNGTIRGGVFLNTCALAQTQYLGAGVSRGIANALSLSGAPFVIANLLPVQDLGAARLAADFYKFAADASVGEALARARATSAAHDVSPALWGGMVLVGNPACRIVPAKAAEQPDEVVELLSSYTDFDAADEQRGMAYRRAMLRSESTGRDPRLSASLRWVDHASRVHGDITDLPSLDALEHLAETLNHPTGVALMCLVRSEQVKTREALERADRALARVAPYNAIWGRARQHVLSQLKHMDLPITPQYMGPPMGDQDKRAVEELLEMIGARDQEQIQRIGVVSVRRPETDLATTAWNSVVLGKHGRFDGPLASLAFARQLADKLVASGDVQPASRTAVICVLSALLFYLWTTQRTAHLDPERAEIQAAALEFAIKHMRDDWGTETPRDQSPALVRVEADLKAYLLNDSDESAGKLRTSIDEALAEFEQSWKDAAADGAAWLIGLLDETLYERRRIAGTVSTIDPMLESLRDKIGAGADRWFDYYMSNGRRKAPVRGNDFLDIWRSHPVPESPAT